MRKRRLTRTREASHEALVLTVALELQAREQAADAEAADADGARRAMREAAFEMGISDGTLERAERLVIDRRRRADARRRLGARVAGWVGAGLLATAITSSLAWVVVAPADAWTERFADRSRWNLTTTPRTLSLLRWAKDGGRDIALVTVDHVADRDDDDDDANAWSIDLEAAGLPAVRNQDALVIEMQGSLPHARFYLYGAPDERWESPLVSVRSTWHEHRLTLRSFEYQRLVDGRWVHPWTIIDVPPRDLSLVVMSLGQHVNPRDARGFVRIRQIRGE
ncbi:MAG: hypothetical protein U1F43_33810 [Myxococcota bacterium]